MNGTTPDDIAETDNIVDTVDFEELLKILNFTDDEFLSVCHKIGEGGVFQTEVCRPADGPAVVATLPTNAEIWFGVNPTKGPARKNQGRGGTPT